VAKKGKCPVWPPKWIDDDQEFLTQFVVSFPCFTDQMISWAYREAVRLGVPAEDAQDVVMEFGLRILEINCPDTGTKLRLLLRSWLGWSITSYRRRQRRARLLRDSNLDEWAVAYDRSAEELYLIKEQNALLQQAISQLNESWRNVIELYYLAELSVREVAERLGSSPGAVKALLHRARLELKSILTTKPISSGGDSDEC